MKSKKVLPESQTPEPVAMAPIKHPRPNPRYRIHLDDVSNAATVEFLNLRNISNVLQDATDDVFKYLYEHHGTPVAVRSVTLVLEGMGGVAYTTGIPLDDLHKEIHLSLDYISNFKDDPVRFREECTGVITHEMVHCWQHNCLGSAPGGLIEGIADYVRLKAGLSPPHWKRGKESAGKRWDEGYQRTAYFLEWLEGKYGKGSISKMNAHMDGKPYEEDKFWQSLFGESIDSLWKAYLKHWDDDDKQKPNSLAGDEKAVVSQQSPNLQGKFPKEFHA